MAFARAQLAEREVVHASALAKMRHGTPASVAGVVITRQRPATAKGFFFITLEDETGVANGIVAPRVYEAQRATLVGSGTLVLHGMVQQQEGVTSLKVLRAEALDGGDEVALPLARLPLSGTARWWHTPPPKQPMDRRALLALTLTACGATQPSARRAARARAAARGAPRSRADRARGVQRRRRGDTDRRPAGTIPVENVRRVVRDGNAGLQACFTRRLEALPCLSGRVELKLRVGADGAVRWAAPTSSTMGDREVERCMIDHALAALQRALRRRGRGLNVHRAGRRPRRAPRDGLARGAARPDPAAAARAARGLPRASRAAVAVTLYVAQDGGVAAAGASADEEGLAVSECVLREVRAWRLPSPGSWYARATFNLP